MIKKVAIIGTVSYFILGILSILFYEERTAFLDIAFHLFYIIKDGDFAIQNNRFGAFFTQIFPLVSSKIGLSLPNVMRFYSIGFVIYYFSVFFICAKVFKNYKFALVMLLFSVFMVTDTFYWIQSEFPQSLAFLILYFGFIHYSQQSYNLENNYWFVPVHTAMLIILVFFHPLILIPFLFLVGYFYLTKEISAQLLIKITITFFLLFLLKSVFFKTQYDSRSMGGVANFIELFPNYFTIPSQINFLKYLIFDYYLLLVGCLGVIAFYLYQRKYFRLTYIMAFFFGYLMLVNVSYPEGDTQQFYIENLYLPLSIFLLVPIIFDILPLLKQNTILLSLGLILMIRIIHIGTNNEKYTDRLEWMKNYMHQTSELKNKKLIIDQKSVPIDTLMMTWATPYEFWLLSTCESNISRSILIIDNPIRKNWVLSRNKKFVTSWGLFEYEEINGPYFNFQDTTRYQIRN